MITSELENFDSIIDRRITQVENIVKIYEDDVETELKNICEEIKNKLKIILEKYSYEHGLILENSVYKDLYLFDISERVKNSESLKHKLISKNLITSIDIKDKESIKKSIIEVDDIIGIKILTNLTKDRKSILNLIKAKHDELKNNGIYLSENDIDNMPEKMQNGRDIYKVKGKYNEYRFELQIKSKIDSAWGDLEHNLFYKDYEFNYIKDNNKKIMNNVGDLLEQVENLLLTVRESKSRFHEDYDFMEVKKSISDKYSKYIEDKFKTKSIFDMHLYRICNIYIDMKKLENNILGVGSFKEIREIELIEKHEESNLLKNFNKIKLDNIHLAMVETILLGVMDKKEYEEMVELILKYLLKFNVREARKKLDLQEGDELLPDIYIPIMNKIKELDIEDINSRIITDSIFIATYINLQSILEEAVNDEIDEDEQEVIKPIINNIITRYIIDKNIDSIEEEQFENIFNTIEYAIEDLAIKITDTKMKKERTQINQYSLDTLKNIDNILKEREDNE